MEYFIDFDFNSKVEALKENIKISFKNDIIEGFNFIGKRADIKKILGVLIAVNFFMSLGATVPLPYIINNVFMLSPKYYGIINGMFPLGIIVGALFVRRIIEKYSHDAIMTFTGIMLSLCTISLGIPLVLRSLFPHNALVIYYILVMFIFGMTIAFVDIPIIFRLQKTVDEKYRGRILSIGISVAKIVQPLAYILSGLLLDVLQPSILVFSGGLMMLASTLAILKFGAKQDAQ